MLNVVLIGVGAVSKSHISAWLKQENARVIGVADFFADRAEAAAKMLGAEKWSDDYRDLIGLAPGHNIPFQLMLM